MGVIIFLAISLTFSFKDKVFSSIFGKPFSFASSSLEVGFNYLYICRPGHHLVQFESPYNIYDNNYRLTINGVDKPLWDWCKDQFFSDINNLGQNGVKILRIWPLLGNFAYFPQTNTWGHIDKGLNGKQNISNFDEFLSVIKANNMKVQIAINSLDGCAYYGRYVFNAELINDPVLQEQYINSLVEFVTRYKDEDAIESYDLANEISSLIVHTLPDGSPNISGGKKGYYCKPPQNPDDPKSVVDSGKTFQFDDENYSKTKDFLNRIYQAVKLADSKHSFTYSFGWPFDATTEKENVNFFRDMVDFYDVHAYSGKPDGADTPDSEADLDPALFYANLPFPYDKPLVHGETGVLTNAEVIDSSGVNCYGNGLTMMSDECQQKYLDTFVKWVGNATDKAVSKLYFHGFIYNTVGERNYQTEGDIVTVLGYNLSKAGQYVTNFNSTSAIQGDINKDKKVDIYDYNTLLSDFGKEGQGIASDLNSSGKVDIFDYNILLENFGKGN